MTIVDIVIDTIYEYDCTNDDLIILATNDSFDLDEAIHRHIDLAVKFPVPREQIWQSQLSFASQRSDINNNNDEKNLSMIMKTPRMQTHRNTNENQDSCIVVNTKSVPNGRQY